RRRRRRRGLGGGARRRRPGLRLHRRPLPPELGERQRPPHGPERPAVDGQGRGAARRRAVVAAAGLEGPAHAAEEGQAVMPAEPQPFAPVEPPTPSPAPTAPEAPRRWFSVPRWREMLVCLLLAAATGAVYSRACRNGFVNYDDDVYVERNAHVRL